MENLIEKLKELSDKKYKEFHGSLCPNTDNIIGVRIPKLREIAKQIAKENPEEFLKQIDTRYYETVMIYGMVIGYMKVPLEIRLKYLDQFVPQINNWAICDCCTSTYKFTQKHKEEMWRYLQKYMHSHKEFEVRFAVIMMMDYYLEEPYFKKVLEILDTIQNEGYYVKMGIAWAISVAFVKNEKETRKYLKQNQLDDFTYNKALQKIVESNRVSKQTKEEIKTMKRK